MKKFFKVAGCILGVIILLIAGAIAVMAFLVSSNNAYKGEYRETLSTGSPSAQKALVVYQPSRNKTSENIANQLAKGLNEAGYEVTLSYPGKHLPDDVSDYTVLVFGSPVFMGQPSTALTDYMKSVGDYSGKKIILYSVGSLQESPEIDNMEKCLNGGEVLRKGKFTTNDQDNGSKAYKLGLEAGKE